MSEHISDFVANVVRDAANFERAYREKHDQEPEHYPLVMPTGNEGVWTEFFIQFITDGTV